MGWLPDGVLTVSKPAAASLWHCEIEVFRWSRPDLLLDPQVTPPGRVLASKGGIGGKTTISRAVRLVRVEFVSG